MAENKKLSTVEQLKIFALKVKAHSAASIADFAASLIEGYDRLFTVTLPAANWNNRVQKVEHEWLLANSGYCYLVCGDADCFMDCSDTGIKADNVTKDGEITFRCEITPDMDLTVNILRLEVDTE